MAEIKAAEVMKLRSMTGAGMMDCKKALQETNGDFDAAIDILRKKGQKIASKRADRDAKEGCVLGACTEDGKKAYIVSLNCETDFVAKNADFVKLTKDILAAAIANDPADADALKALPLGKGTINDEIINQNGVIGEKIELGYYGKIEGAKTIVYNHMGNRLTAAIAFNQDVDATVGKNVAMQVAAMSPIAIDKDGVPQETIDKEFEVAKEKTIQEQIQKAVEAALKKAGINPAHVDSEDHINSNMAKGWITEEQAAQAREIKEKVATEKASNIPAAMVENIAKGRINKFYEEYTLLNQKFEQDNKITIKEYLKKSSADLTVSAMIRFGLGN
ncbi:MAG: translation elongation factor Ts [Bacteroidales bacterium]|nr:translation elongation factor Ts [Bacteroidales bacterium]